MRTFEYFDWDSLPDDMLVVMTAPALESGMAMHVADFTDVQALVFKETRSYVGMSRSRGLRFGARPALLRNGIWIAHEDTAKQLKWKDFVLSVDALSLDVIV